jgi:hypothetical protein
MIEKLDNELKTKHLLATSRQTQVGWQSELKHERFKPTYQPNDSSEQ